MLRTQQEFITALARLEVARDAGRIGEAEFTIAKEAIFAQALAAEWKAQERHLAAMRQKIAKVQASTKRLEAMIGGDA